MRTLLLLATAVSMVVTPAFAKPCRDTKGKFIKCATAPAATAASNVTKDAKGKCHIASGPKKGQFTKCS